MIGITAREGAIPQYEGVRTGEGSTSGRRWWTGAAVPLPEVSGDPSRDGHAESGHAVEHLAADPGLDFLCGQSPGAERSADDGLVAQHPGLDERAPAFASAMFISALARMSVAWGPA